MSVAYLGELTIGACVPGATLAANAGVSGINGALPDIEARLTALLAFSPLPTTLLEVLSLAEATLASIQAALATGALPIPDISAQIALVGAQVADLLAVVTAVNAQLTIVTQFQGLLAAAGVHLYAYTGRADLLGGGLSGALATGVPGGGGPAETCSAIALVTTSGVTASAMAQVFRTS